MLASPLRGKVELHLSLGPRCNNDCVFCLDFSRGNPHRMTIDEVRATLERHRGVSDNVLFTSGEPTTNRTLLPAIRVAHELGFRTIGVISNALRFADEKYARDLLQAGLNDVTLSIHGPDAACHDALTRRPGSFTRVLAALGHLAQLRAAYSFRLQINCTLTRSNLTRMREMADLASRFGANRLNFNSVEARGRAAELFDEVVPRYDEVLEAADRSGLDFWSGRIVLSRVPGCAGGMEWVQAEFHMVDGEQVDRYEPKQGKVRGAICSTCEQQRSCGGLWAKYVERHGWDGLAPVRAPREPAAVKGLGFGPTCPRQCARCDAASPEDIAGLARSMRAAVRDGYRQIVLEKGDPFLNTKLLSAIELARRLGVRGVCVSTCGESVTSRAIADQVARLGCRSVVIRLHGAPAELHDQAVGVRGSFARRVKAAARLVRARMGVELAFDPSVEPRVALELARSIGVRVSR